MRFSGAKKSTRGLQLQEYEKFELVFQLKTTGILSEAIGIRRRIGIS